MTNYYYYYGVTLQNLSIDNILNVSNISILKTLLPSAGGVPAMCDLVTNYCCPTDWPHSDLCQRLGLQG